MSGGGPPPIDPDLVRATFAEWVAVDHYLRAAEVVRLWRSEQAVFRRFLPRPGRLLEMGCGAGRVSLGLHREGWTDLDAVDFCPEMIAAARALARSCRIHGIRWHVADAAAGEAGAGLPFADGGFDGVVFAFNGLMQNPGRPRRRRVLAELARVTRAGGVFVFTTHDRDDPLAGPEEWAREREAWARGRQDPRLLEYGDRFFRDHCGWVFMHIPDVAEVRADLEAAGWGVEWTEMRRAIADEPVPVRAFSDECRFWVARRAG